MIIGCFRRGSLESRIDFAKCGNIGSIEKCLLYIGGKNRECFADIAKLSMIEFAAHPDCFALSATASVRAKKMKLQPHLKSLASILQGIFIADSARRYVRLRLDGTEIVPNLVSWEYWRKKFPIPNPKVESIPIPLFLPVISRHFRTPLPNGSMYRAKIAPFPDI